MYDGYEIEICAWYRIRLNGRLWVGSLFKGSFLMLTDFDRTAVIRNHDGSFENVAKVEMNSEYKEMMKRLSLESSKHPRYGVLTAGPKATGYFP